MENVQPKKTFLELKDCPHKSSCSLDPQVGLSQNFPAVCSLMVPESERCCVQENILEHQCHLGCWQETLRVLCHSASARFNVSELSSPPYSNNSPERRLWTHNNFKTIEGVCTEYVGELYKGSHCSKT